MSRGSLRVIGTGPLATVQDLGRPGYAALGVGPCGAADRGALRLANRLVGNPESAAGIEVLLGDFEVRLHAHALVAVTGAAGAVTVDDRPAGMAASTPIAADSVLRLEPAESGLRRYLAVRGGIDVAAVLGSRSTDTLAGIGPPRLAAGSVLPIGAPTQPVPDIAFAALAAPAGGDVTLRALPGPRADWFDPDALRGSFTVSQDSDRVAVRLDGRPIRRGRDRELPSEGLVTGAVQVPSGGQPLIFLADRPVTGGYPVIAVLTDASIDLAAQLRPGQCVRFSG